MYMYLGNDCSDMDGISSHVASDTPNSDVGGEGRWCLEGKAMYLDWQLLTSLLHDINWGPLDHASCGPN